MTGRQFWCRSDPNPCAGPPARACPRHSRWALQAWTPGHHAVTAGRAARSARTGRAAETEQTGLGTWPRHPAAQASGKDGATHGAPAPGASSLHWVSTDSYSQQWRGCLTQLEHKSGKTRTLQHSTLLEEGRGQDEAQL